MSKLKKLILFIFNISLFFAVLFKAHHFHPFPKEEGLLEGIKSGLGGGEIKRRVRLVIFEKGEGYCESLPYDFYPLDIITHIFHSHVIYNLKDCL